MEGRYVLIGGQNSNIITSIDHKIIELSNKKNPNLLYIGFGSKYAEADYKKIKKKYEILECNTRQLKIKNLSNKGLLKEKLKDVDIIYIGGGDTILLKEIMNQYHLKDLLKEKIKNGCVLVGVSAGAIILSKEGYSDSYIIRKEKDHYDFVEGYNFINIIISPHYEKKSIKTKELIEDCIKMKKEVIALPNDSALIIENNKITMINENNNEKITVYNKMGSIDNEK